MIYNFSPFIVRSRQDAGVWQQRFEEFFLNKNYDDALMDRYYETLLKDIGEVRRLIRHGYAVDSKTGFFSFATPEVTQRHSFALASMVQRHYTHFIGRSVLTLVNDYGIVNLALRNAGITLVNSLMGSNLEIGAILAAVGNCGYPYTINDRYFRSYDTIIASCVFTDDDSAYKNWNFLLDQHARGVEVFLLSDTYVHLRNHMNYDRLQLVEEQRDPNDTSLGYVNRIYKIV